MLSFWRLLCCWWSASIINPDAALLCCTQVTHHCSPSTCGSECGPLNREASNEKWFLLCGKFRLFRGGTSLGGLLTSRLNCAVSWDQCCFVLYCFSWFVFYKCDVWLTCGPSSQCLPVSHTHWVEKHSPRPRWISWENCMFSCSCRYWYHTAVLKRLHCCSCFTFKLALKGYSCYSGVQHLLENCLKVFWVFGDLLDIIVHKYKI